MTIPVLLLVVLLMVLLGVLVLLLLVWCWWRKHPIANKARAGAVRYSATISKMSSGILSMYVLASFLSVMMLWLWGEGGSCVRVIVTRYNADGNKKKKNNEASS